MKTAALPTSLPPDVRVTQFTTALVAAAAAGLLLAAAAGWVARQPLFAFRAIRLDGDVSRNSAATIRANIASRLTGNFFTLDLSSARKVFEDLPWVRHAVVQRIWPNRLEVTLEEHRPAAVWKGDEGNDRLVNTYGEVFEANVGDVDEEDLPEFSGDEASAPEMLAMFRRLNPVFAPLGLEIARLALSGRGSWEAELDNGAVVEIGRGSDAEVQARCERFVRTVTQASARLPRGWSQADLRHADGYALRLKGAAGSPPPTSTPH
ncbi:cell division protein FtsQ/DivIB [Ideonella sp. B7]|uniref:cell division protein FtsQ/DivIB n=1 Tax=Ideonella benzenivorans TaxID=2831643 RepID=UPI001CECFCE0|nr:cell division protein FtsQ/DivIB [Ideonella benzenivorans]MCA6216996.1 cell division protein FtsQ/DivIB [Ideonella benzenivorans]